MYRVKDEYGVLVAEIVNPTFLKQQKLTDFPIACDDLDEADGLVLNDADETYVGISDIDPESGLLIPRGMPDYPQVTVKEVSGESYMMQELSAVKAQLDAVHAYQTETTVLTADLDNAYREGVNSL